MATERVWNVGGITLESTIDYDSGINLSIETYGVKKTASVLWAIKESLSESGWTVMSCSYRTDATGSAGDSYYYPTQSLTTYGQNANPVSIGSGSKFRLSSGDMWTTSSAVLGSDRDIPTNELHRLIYPVYSPFKHPSANTLVSSSAGRSWVLLKNDGDLAKEGKDLYVVLDTINTSWVTTANTPLTASISSSVVTSTALQANPFGKCLNFAAFYGEPNNNPLTSDAISPNVRPYRNDEISSCADDTRLGGALYSVNDWSVPINFTTLDTPHVNYVANDSGGIYVIVTENNTAIFTLGIDRIADAISDSLPTTKNEVGDVVFLYHSSYIRGAMNSSDSTYASDLFAVTRFSGRDGGAITQSNSWFPSIKYFSTVSSTSTPKKVLLTFPSYSANGKVSTASSISGFLSHTATNIGTTYDNTYAEHPLILLDVTNAKPRYIGRLADIKLGPASGINGVMARDSITFDYDRFLLDGIWFPYVGTEPISL